MLEVVTRQIDEIATERPQMDAIMLALFERLDGHRADLLAGQPVFRSDLRATCEALCAVNDGREAERGRVINRNR